MDLTAEHLVSPVVDAGQSPVPDLVRLTGQPCPLCGELVRQVTRAGNDLQVLRPCGCVV
ncbi:hypothetical protein GCM10009527_086670 [Actinomadura nitritigenes]